MQGRCDCWRRCWSVWHVVKSTQSIATRRRRLPWLPCMETPSRANHWWVNPVPRRNCTQSISSNCSTQYYIVDCKGSFNNYVTPFCSIFGPPPPVTTCHTLRPVYSDTTQTSSWVASAGRYRHFADATQLNSTSSWVELRHCIYRHPHRRNSTAADDRQCNWPSWTAYSQSAPSRSVELSWVALASL